SQVPCCTQVEFDENGKANGVPSKGETAKCKKVVCDPSYLSDKVHKVGKVSRAICIMSHPIPQTHDSHSAQRKFIAFVTTEAETDQPEEDLKPGIDLLGSVNEKFYDMYDRFEPCNDHEVDGCFISTSYDPTTHFEITVKDVVGMYSKITGKHHFCLLFQILDLSVDLSAASATTEE
ncbi:hypothetical protein PHAVU_010G107500, partial [Phaseolus vulgaris]